MPRAARSPGCWNGEASSQSRAMRRKRTTRRSPLRRGGLPRERLVRSDRPNPHDRQQGNDATHPDVASSLRRRTPWHGTTRSQAIAPEPPPAPARPVLARRERPAREGGCEVKRSPRSLLLGECRGEDNREAKKAVPRASHSHPPSRAGRALCRDPRRPEAREGQPRSDPVVKLAEGSVAAPAVAIASSLDCGNASSRPKISTKLFCQVSRRRW